MSAAINVGKALCLAVYGLAAISPMIPAMANVSKPLIYFAVILLAIHVFEYFFFKKRLLEAAPGINHFPAMLLFGVLHAKPIFKKAE